MLKSENEFRCFVKNKKLCAITQRVTSVMHKEIASQAQLIKEKIWGFFTEVIIEFLNEHTLNNLVFDVYIDIPPKCNVRLIDVGPFHKDLTNSLLFSFD